MIAGQYFDGRGSKAHAATLHIGVDGRIRLQAEGIAREERFSDVEISDRIGNVPRKVRFTDGAVFETADNDAVDAALLALGQSGFAQAITRWESRWRVALLALVLVGAISWAFLEFGIPVLANVAARALPASVDKTIGREGLQILDKTLFESSKLPAKRQKQLRDRFAAMVGPLDDGHDYRLEFRRSARIGPNAFALPSGIIILTDELVALAKHDDELVAVLAHEIGHVRGRHALRRLLQSAGVAALAAAVLGDVGTASTLASAVPLTLIEAANSRNFEREADAFARQWLEDHGIPRARFDGLLCSLEKHYRTKFGGMDRDNKPGSIASYLASHPPTEERADCSSTPASGVPEVGEAGRPARGARAR